MTVEETLSYEDLVSLEAAATDGTTYWEPETVAMALRELLNLRALWKQRRLWRYAGVADERPDAAVAKLFADEVSKLSDYLFNNWSFTPTPGRTVVDETICLLERCRADQQAARDPWSDGDREAIEEFVEWKPDEPTPLTEPSQPEPAPLIEGGIISDVQVSSEPIPPQPEDSPPPEGKPGRRRGPGDRPMPGAGRGPEDEGEEKPGEGEAVGPGERGKKRGQGT